MIIFKDKVLIFDLLNFFKKNATIVSPLRGFAQVSDITVLP